VPNSIVLFITAVFSSGFHQIDEHVQILEFAGLKLNMTVADHLPWEYHYRIRSGFQPALVVLIFRLFNMAGINNPFTITIFLRLLSASIGFTAMFLIYKTYEKIIWNDTLKRWFLLLSFFLWFAIYVNVRFSSEGWSGSLFIIAFSLFLLRPFPGMFILLLCGFIFGLSFLCRYQAGLLFFGLILWNLFIKKEKLNSILLFSGMGIAVLSGFCIDRWYYGEWTFTLWNYFDQNMLQNKISGFGVNPWWFYFTEVFIQAIPPFSLVYIMSFLLFFVFKKRDILTWILFPFLVFHFCIGHKEVRFLFPLIGFLPVLIIKSIETVQEKWTIFLPDNRYARTFAKFFFIVNLLFLILIAFKPASNQIDLFNEMYTAYQEPAILYYIGDNPYRTVDFYKRPDLELKEVKSAKEIHKKTGKKQLFLTSNKNSAKDIQSPLKIVYTSFPDWLLSFNFNNWLERSNYWIVYELN
jgi:phosphatidylinositol glycan class B